MSGTNITTGEIAASKVVVKPVETRADRDVFIRMPRSLYVNDPHYVAPLELDLNTRLDPRKNPGLKDSPHRLWVAQRNGASIGRIAAIMNKSHLDQYNDGAGHFGFLEAVNEPAVFEALLNTAANWLRDQGATKIAGPFNFSVNEECGLLVEGFDTPPYIMMPHNPPYYMARLEEIGFRKAIDMYALEWIPVREFIPPKRLRFVEKALNKPEVSIRNLNSSDFLNDIRIIIDIFNDAWSENWGFIPVDEPHARHMANELKTVIQEYNVVLCYYKGEPAAFGLVLPNVNRAIRGFNGKLLPFNWAKLLWRLKIKGVDQARMPLMGVRKKLQKRPVGVAFAYKIIDMVNSANIDHGVTHSELSWILENNQSMLSMLLEMGSRVYKTYRIYEKVL